MIKKQNKHVLVKGPPGLVARKSRDSLRMFGVRGDPELNEPGNLTGFENLSGLKPMMVPIFIGSKALFRRPRNDGQTTISSLRATKGSMAICQMGYYNWLEILKQVQDDMDDKKKDCVRVDDCPDGTPKNRSNLGFHRARRMMERNLTGFENLSGFKPTI